MIPLLILLEELVHTDFGTADLSAVRERLRDRPPDEDVRDRAKALLDALAAVQRRRPDEVYVWAGTRLVMPLAKDFPGIVRGHTSARTLLLQLAQVAPTVVADVLPGVTCPEFWQDFLDGETIRIGFDGPVEAAWLLEGVARGLGTHFGERVDTSRADAPPALKERRLVDVKVVPERRSGSRAGRPTTGLSSAGIRS